MISFPSRLYNEINNEENYEFYFKESEIHKEKYYCLKKCNLEKIECIPHFNFLLICRENAYSNKIIKLKISIFDEQGVNK